MGPPVGGRPVHGCSGLPPGVGPGAIVCGGSSSSRPKRGVVETRWRRSMVINIGGGVPAVRNASAASQSFRHDRLDTGGHPNGAVDIQKGEVNRLMEELLRGIPSARLPLLGSMRANFQKLLISS